MLAFAPAVTSNWETAACKCLKGHNARLSWQNGELHVVAVKVQFHGLVTRPMEFDQVAFVHLDCIRGRNHRATFNPNLENPSQVILGRNRWGMPIKNKGIGYYQEQPASSGNNDYSCPLLG